MDRRTGGVQQTRGSVLTLPWIYALAPDLPGEEADRGVSMDLRIDIVSDVV